MKSNVGVGVTMHWICENAYMRRTMKLKLRFHVEEKKKKIVMREKKALGSMWRKRVKKR